MNMVAAGTMAAGGRLEGITAAAQPLEAGPVMCAAVARTAPRAFHCRWSKSSLWVTTISFCRQGAVFNRMYMKERVTVCGPMFWSVDTCAESLGHGKHVRVWWIMCAAGNHRRSTGFVGAEQRDCRTVLRHSSSEHGQRESRGMALFPATALTCTVPLLETRLAKICQDTYPSQNPPAVRSTCPGNQHHFDTEAESRHDEALCNQVSASFQWHNTLMQRSALTIVVIPVQRRCVVRHHVAVGCIC